MKEEKQISLWEQVGNKCLSSALAMLESETAPTAVTVETVRGLVEAAIAIDTLNLRWAEQNRYGAAAFRAQPSAPPEAKN